MTMNNKMTNYQKCKRFLAMVAKRNGTELNESASSNSVYLKLCGRTIRLSDHHTMNHGNQSSGFVSIIAPQNNTTNFVVMINGQYTVSVLTYNQVKEMVNAFSNIPFVFSGSVMNNCQPDPVKQETKHKKELPPDDKKTSVLGVPKELFSPGQLNIIRHTAAKVAKENGFDFKI